jgi:hypothetical protein
MLIINKLETEIDQEVLDKSFNLLKNGDSWLIKA